jgi:hypothetical protein
MLTQNAAISCQKLIVSQVLKMAKISGEISFQSTKLVISDQRKIGSFHAKYLHR